MAGELRAVVTKPLVKGEVSTRLTPRLAEPHRRHCVPCQAIHAWEIPFRISALYAGLELEPGTSPPVLRRVAGWPRRAPGPAEDPMAAPEHLQPIRNYLRFLGPASPQDVAAFLDSSVAEVKAHWPDDAVEVQVEGETRWWLDGAEPVDHDHELVRLLGPYDLLLQARDREILVPDRQPAQGSVAGDRPARRRPRRHRDRRQLAAARIRGQAHPPARAVDHAQQAGTCVDRE